MHSFSWGFGYDSGSHTRGGSARAKGTWLYPPLHRGHPHSSRYINSDRILARSLCSKYCQIRGAKRPSKNAVRIDVTTAVGMASMKRRIKPGPFGPRTTSTGVGA